MAGANLLIQKIGDVTTVEIQDARLLESQQLEALGKELYRLVDEMDRKKLIVDFSKVQFLASAAIGVLVTLHHKCKAAKGSYVICGLKRELMKVFEIMQLTKVLRFAADENEALRAFGFTAAG